MTEDISYWNEFTERIDSMLSYLDKKMDLINEENISDHDRIAEELEIREVL